MTSRIRTSSGFTLVEVMIAMLVVTVGLVSMAQLMTVTTFMHSDARKTSVGTELGLAKLDELAGMNLSSDAEVQVTPVSPDSLSSNVSNYFDQPDTTITRRWKVEGGPTADTRLVTLRVINAGAQQYGRELEFRTIIGGFSSPGGGGGGGGGGEDDDEDDDGGNGNGNGNGNND
jgi:prepilin-type N-terminal cleavage/methylation domain-containing protein